MGRLTELTKSLEAFGRSRRGRRWMKAARAVFVLGVVAWLVYNLSGIGWEEVWEARPRTPWFYVIWLVFYFQLPLIEASVYQWLWDVRFREILPVVLSKRVLNVDVVSYSGEAYLYLKMRRLVEGGDRFVLGTIKDHAIASALGSTLAAMLVVGGLFFAGQITLVDVLGARGPWYVAGGIVLLVVAVVVGFRFRRTLFTLPRRQVLVLFSIHLGRYIFLIYVLQIIQWWVVLPTAPLNVWATMLAIQTLSNRLPLIPAKDLVALGAILGISGLLDASSAVIAAMLLTRSVLDKTCNVSFFALTAWCTNRQDMAATQAGVMRHETLAEAPAALEHNSPHTVKS